MTNAFGAEEQFRQAFQRLVGGVPVRLPPGSPVTQNNVAREAGRDPSALRKGRYPKLVEDIKAQVAVSTGDSEILGPQGQRRGKSEKDATLKSRLEVVIQQRDELASQLVEADARIMDLMDEIEELRRAR